MRPSNRTGSGPLVSSPESQYSSVRIAWTPRREVQATGHEAVAMASRMHPMARRFNWTRGTSPFRTPIPRFSRWPRRCGENRFHSAIATMSDPARRVVELAQRGRMILDVSAADLEAAEAAFGPFHPTAWHFRNALNEARRSWDRLRAEFGGAALEAALNEPPLTILVLGGRRRRVPSRRLPRLWPRRETTACRRSGSGAR